MAKNSEVITIGPQEGPQTKFLESQADIVIFGGAAGGGKSYVLVLDAMRFAIHPHNNRGYRATLFRSSFAQIEQPGGLKETSDEIYPLLGADFHQGRMTWTFPSKAKVSFSYMEHEKDKLKHQGAQIPWIGFDELTHFTESQFFYMLSRNRSACGVPARIRATCNPDSSSWVAEFIEWWIDQDSGYPIPERDGVVRWFIRLDNVMYWGSNKEELWEQVKDFYASNPEEYLPKSVTFIGSKLSDNKILCENDPSYKANLMAMSHVDQEVLLRGNWIITPTEGTEWADYPHYFGRHIWTDHWPEDFISSAMFIDPSKGKTDKSDYSAIVFVGLKGGKMYIKSDISRRPAEQIVQDAMMMFLELRPHAVGVERNSFQDLLAPMFDDECQKRQIPPIPIYMPYSTENKKVRIRSLGPFLEREKFLLHKGSQSNKLLYGQLKDFGVTKHDDGPDALHGAIQLLYALDSDPMGDVAEAPNYEESPDFEVVSL